MPLPADCVVHAARDIRRGPYLVVRHGWPGRIVDAHPSWFETTYTVRFTPSSKQHRRVIVTLVGLNEDDIETR